MECHDCFSCNELFQYEAMGLAPVGSGHLLVDTGEWRKNSAGGEQFVMHTLDSKGNTIEKRSGSNGGIVVNPSGGLESKGHPIGATGVAQAAELVWQLRGMCGGRQVDGARVGLQQNFGIGSAAVVTLYQKSEWPIKPKL